MHQSLYSRTIGCLSRGLEAPMAPSEATAATAKSLKSSCSVITQAFVSFGCVSLSSYQRLFSESRSSIAILVVCKTLQKMASSCSLLFCLFAIIPSLASPLQAPSSPHLALSQLPHMFNSSAFSTLNKSSSENSGFEISCSGEHFGFNPNIADCESAKEYITPDSVQYSWGDRHTGLPRTTFPLPYRIMGGQWSTCLMIVRWRCVM